MLLLKYANRLGCLTKKDVDPVEGENIDDALERIGKLRPWMWYIFILCSLPGVLNIWALISNVFQAPEIPYWCYIPELQKTNWTDKQKRIITTGHSESSCKYYAYDYEKLSKLTFEDAEAVTRNSTVDSSSCNKFSYEDPETSIIAEWDMVCNRVALKSTLQTAVPVGKFIGAFIFGPISDRYGRKRSIFISSMMYIFISPVGVISNYYVFLIVRMLLGIAGGGLYNCCFTLLMEICKQKHRILLGILYNESYAIGLVTLPPLSLAFPKWKHLQIVFSIPSLLLLLTCWFVPESPRWLITKGRLSEAWKILNHCDKTIDVMLKPASDNTKQKQNEQEEAIQEERPSKTKATNLKKFDMLLSLLGHGELRLRLIICCFLWFSLALTYYAIALNSENFSVNRFIYITISGVLEAVSYAIPVPMLYVMGRRTASAILFLIAAVFLFVILGIPKDKSMAIFCCAMLAHLANGAGFSLFVLYTAELFPTLNRNTAVGISSTISNIGTFSAPYIVDLMGRIEWYIPSTICAVLSFVALAMVKLLPETRGRELCNTIEEVDEAEKISLKNCVACFKK